MATKKAVISRKKTVGSNVIVDIEPSVNSRAGFFIDPELERAFRHGLQERLASAHVAQLEESWSSGDIGLAQWSALPLFFRLLKSTNDADAIAANGFARLTSFADLSLASTLANFPNQKLWKYVHGTEVAPINLLDIKASEFDFSVRANAACNPLTPVHVLEQLAEEYDWKIWLRIATNPSTPSHLLEDMALRKLSPFGMPQGAKEVYHEIARHSATTGRALEHLASLVGAPAIWDIAKHPATPIHVLEEMALSEHESIRTSVAKNPSTPKETLLRLAKEDSCNMRGALARNSAAPVTILAELAKDSDPFVLAGLAENASLPRDILQKLINNSLEQISGALISNPNCPVEVLNKLLEDENLLIHKLDSSPNANELTLARLACFENDNVRGAVASHKNTSLETLIKLAKDKNLYVRLSVAKQSHRSEKLVLILIHDAKAVVRHGVFKNENLDAARLNGLLTEAHTEGDVLALISNQKVSDTIAKALYKKLEDEDPRKSPWYQLQLKKAKPEVKESADSDNIAAFHGKNPSKVFNAKRPLAQLMALCSSSGIEVEELAKAANSDDWLIRAAVARYPIVPVETIQLLSADSHPLVSAIATARS